MSAAMGLCWARLVERSQPLRGGVQRGARVGRQAAGQLGGVELLGEAVGLAGPQVDGVGVAVGARLRAQRRGEVVDLGVGARSDRAVLALEAVDDPAREAAGERAGQRGRGPGAVASRCAGEVPASVLRR